MKKLLAITLVCVLLLAVTPLALAQTVAPGGEVTVEVPFSGAEINLLHAEYTVSSGLTVKSGTVPEMMGGKAGKSMALFVSVPGKISKGTLKLVVAAGSGASGDQTIEITKLRGYAPSKWTDLNGKKTITIKLQGTATRVPGDADKSGAVDIDDALTVLQHLAGWGVAISLENADCDGKAGVDIDDALQILQNLAGWGVALL